MQGLAYLAGNRRINLRVPQVEICYRGGRARLADCGVRRVERGLCRRKRGLGRVAFGRCHAAFVGGGETREVALGAIDLCLRNNDARLRAGDFGIAEVLRRLILLLVDLEKKIALLDHGALGEAHAPYVAVDLRQYVGDLPRLDMTDVFARRVEHRVRNRDHGYRDRIRLALGFRDRVKSDSFASEPPQCDQCSGRRPNCSFLHWRYYSKCHSSPPVAISRWNMATLKSRNLVRDAIMRSA